MPFIATLQLRQVLIHCRRFEGHAARVQDFLPEPASEHAANGQLFSVLRVAIDE